MLNLNNFEISIDEDNRVLIKKNDEVEKQFKQQLELITGSYKTIKVLPVTL